MMKQVYVHGLGQTPASWEAVLCRLGDGDGRICPDLAGMMPAGETTYQNLYEAFAAFCDGLEESLDLCGLSLGAVLALHYCIQHPKRVRSLVVIDPQYKMPKGLLRAQNILFCLMPKSMFEQTGFTKSQFLQLCSSMMDLDFTKALRGISCPVLVICGSKDRANKRACVRLVRHLNEAKLQIVNGAGHEINREAPQELARLLCDFYAQIS